MPAAGAQLRLRAIAASAAFSLARVSVVSASTSFVGRGRPLADLPGPLSRVAGKGRETAAMRSCLSAAKIALAAPRDVLRSLATTSHASNNCGASDVTSSADSNVKARSPMDSMPISPSRALTSGFHTPAARSARWSPPSPYGPVSMCSTTKAPLQSAS